MQQRALPMPIVTPGGDPAAAKWARRAVTVPGLALLFALDVALLPLSLLVAAAVDAVKRRPLVALRFQLALTIALAVHVLGLALTAGSWLLGGRWAGAQIDREGQLDARLEAWLATLVWRAAMWLFGIQLVVEGGEALDGAPVLLMSRHASLLDPLLPPFLLGRRRRSLRYVIKHELLWDPCIDFFGHRLTNTFVHRDRRHTPREIARVVALANDLGPSDVVVIFPEGTRFTPEKRERVLASLARGDPAAFDHARRLRNLLPPHPGGALALLGAARHVDVVFCAHTGLEGANHFSDLANGSLVGATVRVKLWRVEASAIPKGADERRAWLDAWWTRIDEWIAQPVRPSR